MTLAQIVAALSVTYNETGVMIWLAAKNKQLLSRPNGSSTRSPYELITEGRIAEVAEAVRRIGDADPSDFTVTERAR